ncbi:bHLH transcriptional regulator [Solanum lycopersicum]|uniref:BHLH transcriptional regulator n=3 Tax=Solanum lycopersicum TaxID=4081 RepID=Q5GA67_SOLLC|nr:bHLH transcriptional regulator [Solanum lycopersicum]AAW22875.1 bHLH transcriptional regulator [Solanum lycopersicum]
MESGNASMENNNVNDIGLINFLDEDNFEQFIELIRGETADPIVNFCPNYDCEHMTGCFSAANAQFEPILSSMDFYDTTLPDPISLYNCEIKLDNNDDEDDDESSGTTATTKMTPTSKGTRTDRSRTLISERKRRGRMKEKLYALRSLVPNITKMDKASIIGDAILYVQGLQTKAKKLKVEIAEFESSSGIFQNAKKMNFTTYYPAIKRITKMDINQVEEKGFYVRLICNKGRHIAASLFKALESLNGFNVQTSNLATSTNDYIFTFTLYVRECHEVDINFGNLKLWIASAFLNQGFDFETSPLV